MRASVSRSAGSRLLSPLVCIAAPRWGERFASKHALEQLVVEVPAAQDLAAKSAATPLAHRFWRYAEAGCCISGSGDIDAISHRQLPVVLKPGGRGYNSLL
jgi:hypothetical protein